MFCDRVRTLSVLLLMTVAAPLAAQTASEGARNLCFRGRPLSRCRAFLIAESGGNLLISPASPYRTLKAQLESGYMRNVGRRTAVGATIFVITNLDDETYWGARPRLRHWFSSVVAVDVAAGPRLASQTGDVGLAAQVGLTLADWISFVTQVDLGRNRLNGSGPSGTTVHLGARVGSYLGALGVAVAPLGLALHGMADSW